MKLKVRCKKKIILMINYYRNNIRLPSQPRLKGPDVWNAVDEMENPQPNKIPRIEKSECVKQTKIAESGPMKKKKITKVTERF